MDVTVAVRRRGVFGQDIVVDEKFGALRAVFEHGAHGRIAVDIGVFALDVFFDGGRESEFFIYIHQIRFCIAYL